MNKVDKKLKDIKTLKCPSCDTQAILNVYCCECMEIVKYSDHAKDCVTMKRKGHYFKDFEKTCKDHPKLRRNNFWKREDFFKGSPMDV
jgi:hypothetical protein